MSEDLNTICLQRLLDAKLSKSIAVMGSGLTRTLAGDIEELVRRFKKELNCDIKPHETLPVFFSRVKTIDELVYVRVLRSIAEGSTKIGVSNCFRLISLGFKGYVTLNYDRHLVNALNIIKNFDFKDLFTAYPPKVMLGGGGQKAHFWQPHDFCEQHPGRMIAIHGYADPESAKWYEDIILNFEQYDHHYFGGNQTLFHWWRTLLMTQSCIFIGTSLEEPGLEMLFKSLNESPLQGDLESIKTQKHLHILPSDADPRRKSHTFGVIERIYYDKVDDEFSGFEQILMQLGGSSGQLSPQIPASAMLPVRVPIATGPLEFTESPRVSELNRLRSYAEERPITDNEIEDAFTLLSKGDSYTDVFYSNLSDIAWLETFQERGMLDAPPEVILLLSGQQHQPSWPILVGLETLAGKYPESVRIASIVSSLPTVTGFALSIRIARCIEALQQPAEVPALAKQLIQSVILPDIQIDSLIRSILRKWLQFGCESDVLTVLREYVPLISRRVSDRYSSSGSWHELHRLDETIIELLLAGYPLQIAEIIHATLIDWREHQLGEKEETIFPVENLLADSSPPSSRELPNTYWLRSFKSGDIRFHERASILAKRLYKCCVQICVDDCSGTAGLFSLLRGNDWELFDRLRWQLCGDFPLQLCDLGVEEFHAFKEIWLSVSGLPTEFSWMIFKLCEQAGELFLPDSVVSELVIEITEKFLTTDLEPHHPSSSYRKAIRSLSPRIFHINPGLLVEANVQVQEPVIRASFQSRGGFVEFVAGKSLEDLAALTNENLWIYLNALKEEDVDGDFLRRVGIEAQAKVFSQLLEREPTRFTNEAKWWRNIPRPLFLGRLLDCATKSLDKNAPPEVEAVERSIGIAEYLIFDFVVLDEKNEEWENSLIAISNFVLAVVDFQKSFPFFLRQRYNVLLARVSSRTDPRLADRFFDTFDWQHKAINSTQGIAVQALIELALEQKESQNGPESWILETLINILRQPECSPAIFAMIGSRLRVLVHVFGQSLSQDILFPSNKPERVEALIQSVFLYEQPWKPLIDAYPSLIPISLNELSNCEKGDDSSSHDLAIRIGVNIAFYHWNSVFSNLEQGLGYLDRYFSIAASFTRGRVISIIGDIFSDASESAFLSEEMINRVMGIWDHRFSQIRRLILADVGVSDFESELLAALSWIECQSFPLQWRMTVVSESIGQIRNFSRPFDFLESVARLAEDPDNASFAIEILQQIILKEAPDSPWYSDVEAAKKIIKAAKMSSAQSVRGCADAVWDTLVTTKSLSFLDLD